MRKASLWITRISFLLRSLSSNTKSSQARNKMDVSTPCGESVPLRDLQQPESRETLESVPLDLLNVVVLNVPAVFNKNLAFYEKTSVQVFS